MEPAEITTAQKILNIPDQSLGTVGGLRVPRANRNLERTEEGSLVMSERNLQIICETDGLYQYPEMNKKIYLHYKIVDKVYGLQKYVNLKSLYLENNVIKKIQNLDHLSQLENLFLQNNMITKMEGMEHLKNLKVLNLSNNNIFTIDGLFYCHLLQSLTLSKNYLSDFASVQHLGQCSTNLTSIDLSDNKLIADERMFDLIQQVKCLYLTGNILIKDMNHYRRTVVGKLPQLMYLDQRGVDQEERMLAEAWLKDGEGGFRAVKEKIMALRKKKKMQARQEIMQSIDVHRKKKIHVFQNNILDAENQIQKIRRFMREPQNANQTFFYESTIAQLMQKIKQNQDFIDSIYKRMGMDPPAPVYSIQLEQKKPEEEEQEGQQISEEVIVDTIEEQRASSEGHSEDNSEGGTSIESGSSAPYSSNSQQSSLQTYNSNSLEQLD